MRAHRACAEVLRTNQATQGQYSHSTCMNSTFAAVVVVLVPSSSKPCSTLTPVVLTLAHTNLVPTWRTERKRRVCLQRSAQSGLSKSTLRRQRETKPFCEALVRLFLRDSCGYYGHGRTVSKFRVHWSLCVCGWIRPSGRPWGMSCPQRQVPNFPSPW